MMDDGLLYWYGKINDELSYKSKTTVPWVDHWEECISLDYHALIFFKLGSTHED